MQKQITFAAVIVLLAAIILPNLRSLYEGIFFYLRDAITYKPSAVRPINRDGRYATLYDLVQLRNSERQAYILQRLDTLNVTVEKIPIPNSTLSDLFIRFSTTEPYTIFSAHYDKLFDDPNYQGASDNTAAVSVLIASIEELARSFDSAQDGDAAKRAFLFTGEEEKGLRGSQAFVEYARLNNIAIKENVNFDNVGRGKLGIRPSADVPGFVFTILFYGDTAYDGREMRSSPRYPLAPVRLTQSILRAQLETTVYERFTALSDSNIFQANSIDTVAVSGDDMRYLELTWHTYADRVEMLDERNLDLAFELIVRYAAK